MLDKKTINEIIAKVARNHISKAFDYYEQEDIEQEVWVIALQKLGDFDFEKSTVVDEAQALERFLNTVVSNRLKNLYRDKHVVPSKGNTSNFCTPFGIDDLSFDLVIKKSFDGATNEIGILILNNIEPHEFIILEALLSGERIPSYYKSKLKKAVKKILGDNNGTNPR